MVWDGGWERGEEGVRGHDWECLYVGVRESIREGACGGCVMPCHGGGQLAGSKTGMTECDRGSGELGLGESRHNNADGRGLKPQFNHSHNPPANRKLHSGYQWQPPRSVEPPQQSIRAFPSCQSLGLNGGTHGCETTLWARSAVLKTPQIPKVRMLMRLTLCVNSVKVEMYLFSTLFYCW